MEFIFKHFGKFWLLAALVSLVTSLSIVGVVIWAVIKLVNHFT